MPNVTLDDRVQVPDDVVHRPVLDETVLLNLDSGSYYGLDQVGSRTWELLVEGQHLRAAYDTLLREYDVSPADLQRDLLRLVEELRAKGLVEVIDPQA